MDYIGVFKNGGRQIGLPRYFWGSDRTWTLKEVVLRVSHDFLHEMDATSFEVRNGKGSPIVELTREQLEGEATQYAIEFYEATGRNEWRPTGKTDSTAAWTQELAMALAKEMVPRYPPATGFKLVEAKTSLTLDGWDKVLDDATKKNDASAPRVAEKFVWLRFWAKQIDVFVFALLWAALTDYLNPDPIFYRENSSETTMFWFGLLVYPFWEAAFVAVSGTSIGRLPFGLRVRDSTTGRRPAFDQSLKRTWRCWIWGCGLSIPIVSWLTMLSSKGYLEEEDRSSWDEIAGTEVVRGPSRR